MASSIRHQLFFPHPPSAVWQYLTDADLMQLWLMKSNYQPIKGHEFQFRIKPMPSLNFDGIVYCEVLEIEPFKNLSYSWQCGPGDGSINIDSVVHWELQAKGNGTELILNHSDFAIMENIGLFDAMKHGWVENMQKILNSLSKTDNGKSKS